MSRALFIASALTGLALAVYSNVGESAVLAMAAACVSDNGSSSQHCDNLQTLRMTWQPVFWGGVLSFVLGVIGAVRSGKSN